MDNLVFQMNCIHFVTAVKVLKEDIVNTVSGYILLFNFKYLFYFLNIKGKEIE